MRKAAFLALPFTALLLAGCPSDPGVDEACERYVDAVSNMLSQCGSSPEILGERARFVAACTRDVAAPGSGTTPAFLDACAASLEGKCTLRTPECATPPGTLADGAACATNDQCKSSRCGRGVDETCGRCAPRKALGQPCDPKLNECVEGATCKLEGESTVCKATPPSLKEGERCGDGSSTTSCESGLTCDYAGTQRCVKPGQLGAECGDRKPKCDSSYQCAAGKCAEPPGEGSACDLGATQGRLCKRGLTCDFGAKRCVKVVYAKPGESCDLAKSPCARGSCPITIAADGSVVPGKCPTVLADGAACDPKSTAATCDSFSECTAGKCQAVDGTICK